MLLGRIVGKTNTKNFNFQVEGNARNFSFCQVMNDDGKFVLAQIVEIAKDKEKTLATCNIFGYRDEGKLMNLDFPLTPGIEVLEASDEFVKKVLGLEKISNQGFIGLLNGRNSLKVALDLNKVLTRHLAVLAKTGAGKSYCLGVILEELMERKIPIVVLDPHGEYSTLKYPNPKDREKLELLDLQPKGYLDRVQEYTLNTEDNPEAKPLRLSMQGLTASEIMQLLPAKLSNAQMGLLYGALKNVGMDASLDDVQMELEMQEDNNQRWTLINVIDYMRKLNLFSANPTTMQELVSSGKISLINLRGLSPDIQEVVAYKLVYDLFMQRKKGNIPPFLLVIEECHNFCPERSYGEAKSSGILRQIASEGRKFGLGLAVVTQRPARVDKSILSQCGTQVILKVTNPNDIKAISNSVEGMTSEAEKEIQSLPIGTAMITGVVDMPLFVNIRPRWTKHGGETVKIFAQEEVKVEDEKDFKEINSKFEEEGELLPVINQKYSVEDVKLMHENVEVEIELRPCIQLFCNQGENDFYLLIDLTTAKIVTDTEKGEGKSLLHLKVEPVSEGQRVVLNAGLQLKEFTPGDIFKVGGVQFSELYDLISILEKKGYFVKKGSKYAITPQIEFLSSLDKTACYDKVEYLKINGRMQNVKYDASKIREFLAQYVKIKNEKECYLVLYNIKEKSQEQDL